MKKILFLTVMTFLGLTADAQQKSFDAKAKPMSKSQVSMQAERLQQPLQVAGTFNAGPKEHSRLQMKSSLRAATPLTNARAAKAHTARKSAMAPAMPVGKAFAKSVQHRTMTNLTPMLDVAAQVAPRKAATFKESYHAVGYDYFEKTAVEWTMAPITATRKEAVAGSTDSVIVDVPVLMGIIPAPEGLEDILPNGVPVEYSIDADGLITIKPQALLSYQNEAKDSTFYITLFSANSDDEDGIINMQLGEDGKLEITNGNYICLGEFADVEFDLDMGDSEAFLGMWSLVTNVNYYYAYGMKVEQEYNGSGIDAETGQMTTWTMKRATFTFDEEQELLFIDMIPLLDEFTEIYPDGVDVEYTQNGNIITVKPQYIAGFTARTGEDVSLLLMSTASDTGDIVLTLAEDGTPKTIKDESIAIGAWITKDFDKWRKANFTFNDSTLATYAGYYYEVDRVRYQLPGAAPLAPEDVAAVHDNTMLFAGMGVSGYHYSYNLTVAAAYAPTTFRNITQDPASAFEWQITDIDDEDKENTITANTRDFILNTVAGHTYVDMQLVGDNQGSRSEPYKWGCMGYELEQDGSLGEQLYDSCFVYAGGSDYSFTFSDGSTATMTNKNLDDDIVFYSNWGTPDISSSSMSKIYSYQGKPASPLFITGVTLPLVNFKANEDFNLHIKLYKCTRDAVNGTVTLGDVIAEADATSENIDDQYASQSGLVAINFTELYSEDDMGLSTTLDYLFIEDEFLICIEDWDNGTFSGVIGSDNVQNGRPVATWFEDSEDKGTENEGYLWRYTSWKPQLFIGFLGATYGYLHTTDNTNLSFGSEGGEASIHVEPMYYATDDESGQFVPSLYLESITIDGEEAEELPEWLTVGVANLSQETVTSNGAVYPKDIDYDLVFQVAPLDATTEGRTADIVYMQRGALLKVSVQQGKSAGGKVGDVNGDGAVDVADISAVIIVMAEGSNNPVADVNGDGAIDVADISAVITIMAGL